MQRASQQAPTQTTATPEASHAATPASAQAHAGLGYSGNRAALRRLAAAYPNIQCKLTVGSVNDPLEAEADRVADQAMRTPDPIAAPVSGLAAPPKISRKCDHCEDEEKQNTVQRKEKATGPATAPPSVHEALNSPGQPLDPAARAFMEPRFGHDFNRVRVHTGPAAAESTRSISALAFTSAHDIVFNSGQYSPSTSEGRRLLAHELTHVVQQETGNSGLQHSIQREEAPVDAAAVANDVEQLATKDEKGALDKLKALDMAVLLRVIEQIYDDAVANVGDEGKRNAHTILGNDILPPDARPTPGPGDSLTDAERIRLRAAFDAAPTRKQRNPKEDDPGTNPTLSASRDMSKSKASARPGDWGEDPGGNTWIAHSEGIRSYFGSGIPSKMRTSTWIGKNPSNFDYAPSLTKRAIASFHWGIGVHHFATYLSVDDASADLRDRVKVFPTIISYIRAHLGNNPKDNNRSPEAYVKDMKRAATAVNENDPTSDWTGDDTKWASLIEGFKSAEGWKEGTIITSGNVKSISSDPKDAKLVAYYQGLLGVTP